MKSIWVYEAISGGGLPGEDLHDSDLLAQGLRMRDALVADLNLLSDYEVTVASLGGLPRPPGRALVVSPRAGESALAFNARQAARHDMAWVVAPETGGLLAALHGVVDAPRWVGCDAAALLVASSKSATTACLVAVGFTTPQAFWQAAAIRRWIVKPDDGAGALDSQCFDSLDAARAGLACRSMSGAPAVLEPWVEGDALSLSLLCGGAGPAQLLSVNRQHITLGDAGRLRFDGVTVNAIRPSDPRWPVLQACAAQVAAAISGLRGFVGVDLVWHAERGPVLIEVNPRLTSAYFGLSAALRRNVAAAVLAAHELEFTHDGT